MNQLYVESDSICKSEVIALKKEVVSNEKKIQQLKSSRKKLVGGLSVGGIVLFIIGLLI